MDKKTIMTMKKAFDDIMHTTEDGGVEFWYARELMECLGYATWRRFRDAVERAKESCKSAGIEVSDHFADVGKMIRHFYSSTFARFLCSFYCVPKTSPCCIS